MADAHLVTCDLIPLAVLKLVDLVTLVFAVCTVTCDLIPLAVLKQIKAGRL